jgi:hypothetical protein
LGGFLDEVRNPLGFFLETGDEVIQPILKEHDEAESEKHKKHEPEQSAEESHARRLADGFSAVNDSHATEAAFA